MRFLNCSLRLLLRRIEALELQLRHAPSPLVQAAAAAAAADTSVSAAAQHLKATMLQKAQGEMQKAPP